MADPERFDERIALEEIELYAETLIAAGAAEGPLSVEELDRVLGVEAGRSAVAAEAAASRVTNLSGQNN